MPLKRQVYEASKRNNQVIKVQNITELFHKYRDDVYRLAVSYTRNSQEAEDVCQTVFLKLMEQSRIKPGKEKNWLMRVAANECRSLLRSHWWRNTVPIDETLSAAPPETGELWHSLMKLDPKYRVVLYLHYYEGYSTKGIGKLLNISQSAVTTRLSRARQALKEEIKEAQHMERMIKEAFKSLTMPDATAVRIEQKLEKQAKSSRPARHILRYAAVAVSLMIMVTTLCIPGVAQELEKAAETLARKLKDTVAETIILYESENGDVTLILQENENGTFSTNGEFEYVGLPNYLKEENQRLYFVGNGEHIDITDLISYEKPFVYTYRGAQDITHYIAVGGVYDPDPEKCDVGFAAWYYSDILREAGGGKYSDGCICGYCQYNWSNYKWLEKGKEELGIPWP